MGVYKIQNNEQTNKRNKLKRTQKNVKKYNMVQIYKDLRITGKKKNE